MSEPSPSCGLCPRLKDFRVANCATLPSYFNAPVPCFGPVSGRMLIVGLAPGLHGANQTGRPFTGDYAGDLLYATLLKLGLAQGDYDRRPDDGMKLVDCRIANAVRCVPPQNKPLPVEIRTCRPVLADEIAAMKNLKVIFCLGKIAHDSVCDVLNLKKSAHPFGHAAVYRTEKYVLISSYHCSRYNTSTKRLTTAMFESVLGQAKGYLDEGVS